MGLITKGVAACILALAATTVPAGETRIVGTVTRVSDGDTLWIRPEAPGDGARPRPLRVRLAGLDAPERCQAHGAMAGAALSARVLGRQVTVRRRATDDYGRALGSVWLGSQDVGAWLVREGHAWSARHHGAPRPYASEEREARAARRGLFADPTPLMPRDFRRVHGPCDAPA